MIKILLKEENLQATSQPFLLLGVYDNKSLVIAIDHALNKTLDSFCGIASPQLGIQGETVETIVGGLIAHVQEFFNSTYDEQVASQNPKDIEHFNIALYRDLKFSYDKQPIKYRLYYNMRFNLSLLSNNTGVKPEDMTNEEWAEKCFIYKKGLKGIQIFPELSDKPTILIAAFTAGMKRLLPYSERVGEVDKLGIRYFSKFPYQRGIEPIDIIEYSDSKKVSLEDFKKLLRLQKTLQ